MRALVSGKENFVKVNLDCVYDETVLEVVTFKDRGNQ